MTLVSVFSIKGAPGVTTLACLLAAAWSAPGPVVVAEVDPSGGDLAARFGLSSRVGWVSLASSTRRSDGTATLDDHLQHLPGGLPVLVGARGVDRRSADGNEGTVVRSYLGSLNASLDSSAHTSLDESSRPRSEMVVAGLTVVDLGRYSEGDKVSGSWLRSSDISVLVVPGEASAAVTLRGRAPQLLDTCEGRLGLAVLGGTYGCSDMATFTGIDGICDLPVDPSAAAMACGGPGSGRRLELSLLWAAVGKLADALVHRLETGGPAIEAPIDPADGQGGLGIPVSGMVTPPRRSSSNGLVGRFRSWKIREESASPDGDHEGAIETDPVDARQALRQVGA